MKKILNVFLVLLLTVLLIPNVFASNNISIESISLKEKSENLLELSKPTINGMNLGFDLSFLNLGDKAKYEVIISNNSNKEFYIDNQTKFNTSKYITYTYEFAEKTDRIKPNSTLKMNITIEYTSPVPPEKLVNGMYTEDNAMSMDLSDVIITNPSTYANVIALLLIFITLIVITILNISKKKKVGINLLLIGLLLIPITTYALEKITIKATTKILIEAERNIIESRYTSSSSYEERDFWQYYRYIKTVTFKTKIEEPSNYAYKFDVSEDKNNSIIAYLIKRTDNPELYDLYIMSNGYIYANPDSRSVFYFFLALTEVNNVENYKTIYAENMSGMFEGAITIEELDLSSFDTRNVTNMSRMFALRIGSSGHGLLKKLNIDNWDTSKVTDMSEMFMHCAELPKLDVSHFNTSNVLNMNYIFTDCQKLESIDVTNWNTSKVKSMYCMFSGCKSLEELDLSSFDTSSVEDMEFMISGCEGLKTLDLSNFDTSNVTRMDYMFSSCTNLESINLSSFDTSKVTQMNDMFGNLSKITYLDLSNFDTSNVENMSYMFYKDKELKTLDISSFNISNLSFTRNMFEYDDKLETIYVSNIWDATNIANSEDMFKQCIKLPHFNPSKIDKTNANTSDTGYLTLKS